VKFRLWSSAVLSPSSFEMRLSGLRKVETKGGRPHNWMIDRSALSGQSA